jgi:hypothetical protein
MVPLPKSPEIRSEYLEFLVWIYATLLAQQGGAPETAETASVNVGPDVVTARSSTLQYYLYCAPVIECTYFKKNSWVDRGRRDCAPSNA